MRAWLALVVLAAAGPVFGADSDCGSALPAAARQQVAGAGWVVAWAPSRWPIPVGQHFSLQVQLCADAGRALPTALRVDADMPAHRHGMNYRTTVKDLGQGRFQAEGLLFHMPGRWRVRFDLGQGAQAARLDQELDVR